MGLGDRAKGDENTDDFHVLIGILPGNLYKDLK